MSETRLESRPPTAIAVLVSGRGSNLRALLGAIDAGSCHARVIAVISDRAGAAALELARERGIPDYVVSPKQHADRPSWDVALAKQVAELQPELVVMAGFMRLIGTPLLERFGGKIINVHPSLLPAFPGIDAPEQAIAARVRISGCTVHLVDAGVDSGPVLAQAAVPVHQGDDPAALHLRIQAAEHALLPAVVNAIATGAIELAERPTYRGPARDDAPLISPPLF